ncbi:hypothetical protein [Mycobacterium sp. UM_Kg1]|uniref:hypothetical protein n=1 Tax=Mycobacterium sp. UM_Kg1 TaxID=1545691 RepID=UPI00061B0DB7|nr:hypothetical protein [Mycobacterium sp. UM_Kg1]
MARPVRLTTADIRRSITITNTNGIIGVALVVMLLFAVPVDPRKSTASKWLYWLIGPLTCAALFAVAIYGSVPNPATTDLLGAVAGGAIFSYLGFGGAYLRKLWQPGR